MKIVKSEQTQKIDFAMDIANKLEAQKYFVSYEEEDWGDITLSIAKKKFSFFGLNFGKNDIVVTFDGEKWELDCDYNETLTQKEIIKAIEILIGKEIEQRI